MSKHTPGPWYIDKDYLSGSDTDIGDTTGTSMFYACCCGHVAGDNDKQTAANARLIAAAPEMLELISCLSQAYDDRQSGHDLAARLYDLRCVALRLLAKIEGGEA